ncbi:MAG: hypothetical protein IAI50_07605, partial [Candidatus Eremiobacteraeota bacterium]|nr:hypothetical protein [Candidatus Eremiobacteraeota bacterium]
KPGEQWRYDVIHDFQVGNPPENEALIKDASGDLYGEEYGGSPNAADIVYKLTPSARNTEWPETVLHVFPRSEGNLFVHFGPSGILYGSTANGGGAGAGSIFELMP